MSAHRTLMALAVAGVASLLVGAPAHAHGAPTSPVSRAAACGAEAGETARSDACRAAVAASGQRAVAQWDNLRLPNVAGRDREVVPDGKLCSGGIDTYRGLDLARKDWPATRLTAGADYTFTYRGTIPHKGTFRLYVTKEGFDPGQPLSWSDLEQEPFLAVPDPTFRTGSYRFTGGLPQGRSGRHVIYTIWQNSDTPDTYYSCSDVDFGAPAAPPASPSTAAPVVPQAAGQAPAGQAAAPATEKSSFAVPLAVGGGVAFVLIAAVALLRRRRTFDE